MSQRLELPAKSVLPDRYDRIVAETEAQMNAFVPESGAIALSCYCKDTQLTYTWNGSSWAVG